MKTISKRFLKASLAMLLVVMMLFSSTITGFAAVVDNAQTSADVDVSATGADIKGYIYYDNSLTKWSTVQILLGHGSWSQGYVMTRIANTDIWYYNMSNTWSGATQIAVFNASSTWGGEGKSVSARIQYMDQNSACKTFSTSYTSGLLLYGTSSSDNFTLSMTSKTYAGLNANQTANVHSAAAGSSTFEADAKAGTVTVSGRYLSSATASATRSASSTLNSTSSAVASLARGTTVTMTAEAADGYSFVGWYSGSTLKSSSATYTYTGTGSTATYTARFQAEPTYTATFKDWDGSVLDTQTGLKDGETPVAPANPTRDGYNFAGWDPAITAINGADQTYTAQYQLAASCSPVMANLTLDVNGTGTVTATTNEYCTDGGTFSYSLVTPTDGIISLAGNSVTALKPGTTKVKATCACGKTVTCDVTVNTPNVSLTPETVKLIVGQTMTDAFTTTADGDPEITISAGSTDVISISGNKATALKAGTATVTASFKYNDSYTATKTATVTVSAPSITANPTSVALEFGDGSTATSKTVALTPNTSAGNGTGDDITVSSDNTNVATATVSGTTLTINATGLGSTTVKATFHGTTVEIPVTVTQYDPYVYLYVTDNNSWGSMYVYSWKGSNTVVTPITTSMIYIGKNGDGNNIFAYRFLKTNLPENVIFAKNSSWGSQTADTAINWNNTNHRALYFASNSDRSTMNDWTSDCMIVRPTVSVGDVVVPVAGTETATATVENGDVVYWTMADTNTATVANVTTATATVTGVTPGDTTISARAFVDTANSSIKTLPTNYKTQTSCWPYISTEATATVTVGSVDYDITAGATYSVNGTDYNAGTTGGTVSITVDGENKGTSASVAHGKDYTLTATAAENYRFVGWYNGDECVDTNASYTVNAKAAADYTAKFVRTCKISVIIGTGIELIKFNNVPYTENFDNITVDAGSNITVYASPATDYAFDKWTVSNGTESNEFTTAQINLTNIQESITLTSSAIPVYTATATAQTNKYFGTYGGTVTIDGQTSPVQYKNGETATFEATNNTNYYFDGWYTDTEFTNKVSEDAEYQVTMTEEGITLYALFVKNFYLTSSADEILATFVYNVAENSYSVTADFADHFTITSNDNNDVTSADVNVTGGTHTGCTVAGHYTSYQVTPDTENYDITAPVTYTLTPDLNTSGAADGTYTMNIALSDAEKVEISVNGTKVADKAIGSKFSYEITAPEGQYLSGATTAPAVDFEIVDGKIEFTVPDSNVNIVPDFANYSYVEISDTTGITVEGKKDGYKAGEPVEITLKPASDATTITEVTANNAVAVATQNNDGSWTVTIESMPADTTITLTPTIDAKFKMDYGTAAIGNYGSGYTTYGTVSMKIGDTTLAKGGYAEPTDTVTYTATPNTNFIFDGWYSDAACSVGSLVSRNTSYDVTPTGDTTLYALFVPKHYIAEDYNNVATHVEMTYDPATRSFKYTSSTMSNTAWFRVSNNPTTSYWTDSTSYCIFDSNFNVSFNANAYMATVGWGSQCYALNVSEGALTPYEIIVKLNGNSSIDVSCKAAKDGTHIYLSSGRVDVPGSYNSAVFDATTEFIDEDITNPTDINVDNEGEVREKYKKLKITEPRTVSFETTITGTAAPNYEVDKFVVYHIEEERYEIVTPLTMGNNTYQGSVYVESDCYIVPIYFVTEAYATANNLAQIDIYFDATAIKDQAWGPFVACYAWGTNSAEYFGGWSAQLMIPSEDGTSFYTMVTVPAKGNTAAGNVPNGVTFNNYTQSTVPGSNPGAFGIDATQYQCYDYREPITLYEEGYEVITFVAKDSTDGYHGDRANGVTANTVTSSTTDIFNKYDFDYLYSRDGVTPMDLNGDAIESGYAKLKNGEKADYYIINKGDITYDPNGTKYVGDNQFDADWAVDWYVFDKDGKYITTILSTAMWDDETDSAEDGLYTYLHKALGVTAEQVAGKTVAISYEHENNAGHQVSYDGQWYGNMLDHKITADVKVGLIDGDLFDIDDDNIADYGEGYVIDVEGDGGKYQSVEISLDLGEVSLSATTTTDSYYFAGWYTYANGKYTQIGKSLDYTTYIDNNKTYYAMFREVGDDQVVFNHMVYNNPNDTVIPSHGGTSTMWIEIYEGDTLISKGTPSTSSSTAMIDSAVDGTTYTVKVFTTPLMNGEFFAWYTDSEDANGTKTYEEILTLDEHIDKTTTVESSFEYTYTYDAQKVTNIYSDVIRVSNKADLFFKYKNRYGEWRTYTVRDIELTDDECFGYAGNEDNAYYPTYLTKYVMENSAGTQQVTVYGEEAMEAKKTEGYDVISSENNLQQYAPSSDVTEVFNGTVNWNIADTTIKPGKSMITIEADQGEPTYTIKYTAGTQSGTRTGVYNDLATIEPDAEYEGNAFSHWEEKDKESGEWVFLTYNKRYSYRIVEDKEIRAVYGDKLTDEWVPSIDSVTYTREYQDTSDIIYTDFLLAYNSKTGVKLNDVKDAQNIKYGLLMVMDPNYRYDGNGDVKYLEPTEANLITAAEYGKNKLIDGIRYYNFDLTSLTLTNFNRCDYFKSFDNRDTTNNYKGVAYTCYAYLIKDGKVYLSNPENVNFYELAMEDVTSSN